MGIKVQFQRLYHLQILRLLSILAIVVGIVNLALLFAFPYQKHSLIQTRSNRSTPLENGSKKSMQSPPNNMYSEILQTALSNSSLMGGDSIAKLRKRPTIPISAMNLLLLQNSCSNYSLKPQPSSAPYRELQKVRLQIENAPLTWDTPRLHAFVFRNVSRFKRSYELMEKVLKVYVYKEGEKPLFHQPYLKGKYASEGWFMKQMEESKRYVVGNPEKAHLFYLPFSSVKLRRLLPEQNSYTEDDLQKYLKNYVEILAERYHFWNRTNGADHFFVACHDWAPHFTRENVGSCIRVLCSANVARGFRIGRDISLPMTNVLTEQDPTKYVGGNPSSKRPILAFFAGGMHGYLRPKLHRYWGNKEQDMKIVGPMPRDGESEARYRELMKSSKYCICPRGTDVFSPRVVESIHYECVPVIISDNYVPPFFEILDWEAFSVFILEKDIPNLRKILLSIPKAKYLQMQHRVKMVQQHFLWHREPKKYDLFHMILHSVWSTRVFQVTPK